MYLVADLCASHVLIACWITDILKEMQNFESREHEVRQGSKSTGIYTHAELLESILFHTASWSNDELTSRPREWSDSIPHAALSRCAFSRCAFSLGESVSWPVGNQAGPCPPRRPLFEPSDCRAGELPGPLPHARLFLKNTDIHCQLDCHSHL